MHWFALLLVLAWGLPALAAEPSLQSPFMELLTLRDARSARASSWDRTGGNQDWITLPAGQTRVLADLPGAGCIKHIYWTYIVQDRKSVV